LEISAFEKGMKSYPKEFWKIKKYYLGKMDKTVADLVHYYYIWKKSDRYTLWLLGGDEENETYLHHSSTVPVGTEQEYEDEALACDGSPNKLKRKSASSSLLLASCSDDDSEVLLSSPVDSSLVFGDEQESSSSSLEGDFVIPEGKRRRLDPYYLNDSLQDDVYRNMNDNHSFWEQNGLSVNCYTPFGEIEFQDISNYDLLQPIYVASMNQTTTSNGVSSLFPFGNFSKEDKFNSFTENDDSDFISDIFNTTTTDTHIQPDYN